MKLTTPIHVLKQRAKNIKKANNIPLNQALKQVAMSQGYNSWSLLHTKQSALANNNAVSILNDLNAGELLLIGARPNLGKTKLAIEMLLHSIKHNPKGYFFSLEYTKLETIEKIRELAPEANIDDKLLLDFSEQISCSYIIDRCQNDIQKNALIVIDYLQLLDQARHKPELQTQVQNLKAFANATGCIIVFISQIDRGFENGVNSKPSINDVRLPNSLDLSLFDKSIFI